MSQFFMVQPIKSSLQIQMRCLSAEKAFQVKWSKPPNDKKSSKLDVLKVAMIYKILKWWWLHKMSNFYVLRRKCQNLEWLYLVIFWTSFKLPSTSTTDYGAFGFLKFKNSRTNMENARTKMENKRTKICSFI